MDEELVLSTFALVSFDQAGHNDDDEKHSMEDDEQVSSGTARYMLKAAWQGNRVAVVTDEPAVRIFKTGVGATALSLDGELRGHDSRIMDAQFAVDNPNLLATASLDGSVIVWNLENQKQVLRVRPHVRAECDDIGVHSVALRSDLLVCGGANDLAVWTLGIDGSGTMVAHERTLVEYAHHDNVQCLRWHPSQSNLLLSGGGDGLVQVHDVTKEDPDEVTEEAPLVVNYGRDIRTIDFFSGHKPHDCVCVTTVDHSIALFSIESADCLASIDADKLLTRCAQVAQTTLPASRLSVEHNAPDAVSCLLGFRTQERFGTLPQLIAGSADGTVHVLDLVQNQQGLDLRLRQTLREHSAEVRDFAQGPGASCVTVGEDSKIALWDTQSNVARQRQQVQHATRGRAQRSKHADSRTQRPYGGAGRRRHNPKRF
ncbi:MAG: hypothetical protein MHM6MM_002441 [Cercozoa sp. M6MM]